MNYPRILRMALIMVLGTVSMNVVVGQTQFVGKVNRTTDAGPDVHIVTLSASLRGVMTSLPTNVNFVNGHSFIPGDIVDIHWGETNIRRGSTVKNVDATNIDFETTPAPEGEIAVPELEDVWVVLQTRITVSIDPTKLALVATGSSRQAYTDFRDATGTLFLRKLDRHESWLWLENFTWENVLLGGTDVIEIRTSTRDIRGGQFFVFFHFNS